MPTTRAGQILVNWFTRFYHPDSAYEPKDFEADIVAIEKEVIANLDCPAAKHHRLRKLRAAKIIDWDEFGPVYGAQELEVDRCTACGFDFTTKEEVNEK